MKFMFGFFLIIFSFIKLQGTSALCAELSYSLAQEHVLSGFLVLTDMTLKLVLEHITITFLFSMLLFL